MKLTHRAALAGLMVAVSPLALAHPGHSMDGFSAGLAHPLTGLDHLAMLLSIGALGAWQGGRRRLALYAGALASMFTGAMLGLATGWGQGIEAMILLSLAAMAVTLWFRRSSPLACVASLVLVLFHGWAHGLEVPPAQVLAFMPGMLVGSAGLLGAGFCLGRVFQPRVLGLGSGLAALAVALAG